VEPHGNHLTQVEGSIYIDGCIGRELATGVLKHSVRVGLHES